MLRAVVGWVFGMPDRYPGAACIITGLYALAGVLTGISAMATPTAYNVSDATSALAVGVAVVVISLALLGLTIYAAVDTQFFQQWTRGANGKPTHGFVRWTGPVLLGLSLILTVFAVILTLEVIKAAVSNS